MCCFLYRFYIQELHVWWLEWPVSFIWWGLCFWRCFRAWKCGRYNSSHKTCVHHKSGAVKYESMTSFSSWWMTSSLSKVCLDFPWWPHGVAVLLFCFVCLINKQCNHIIINEKDHMNLIKVWGLTSRLKRLNDSFKTL